MKSSTWLNNFIHGEKVFKCLFLRKLKIAINDYENFHLNEQDLDNA